jgi:hypothetical protein
MQATTSGPHPLRFAPPSAFTFKEPYPPAEPAAGPKTPVASAAASGAGGSGTLKQRRVSLAVPPSARVVPLWTFRDDTTVEKHVAETPTTATLTATSMHDMMGSTSMGPPPVPLTMSPRQAYDIEEDMKPLSGLSSDLFGRPEKKVRKKWTMEETQMLVDGCNKVCISAVVGSRRVALMDVL